MFLTIALLTVLGFFLIVLGICCWRAASPVSIRTIKRDGKGLYRFILTNIRLWHAKFYNFNVGKIFDNTVKKHPNKVCFYFEDQEWTFRQVQDYVNQIGNYFSHQGYKKGDTIGLFMENRPEYICIWLGLSKIGVIPALINYNLRLNALEHSFNAAKIQGIIYGSVVSKAVTEVLNYGQLSHLKLYEFTNNSEKIDFIPNSIDLKTEISNSSTAQPVPSEKIDFYDNLFYIFTSGTTGFPKAAVIKHGRYIMAGIGSHYMQSFKDNDILYTALPFYHSAAGIIGIGHAIVSGTSIAFRKKFSASNFWKDCIKFKATKAQYIGEICRYLLTQPISPEEKLHKVELMYGNGLRREIWTEFTTRFNIAQICEIYGSTEGNCYLVNIDNTVGAVGFLPRLLKPLVSMRIIKVDKETGEPLRNSKTGLTIECEPNEAGELIGIIKEGDPIKDFQGYTDKESRNKKLVRDVAKKGDAAFRSGDILVMDEYGYIYFKDRQGDTFRWKGENVSTAEVESVVSKVSNLKDAVVYGVQIPGTEGRAGMTAIVDEDNSLDLNILAFEMEKHLPSYARPLFVRVINQIDMTGTYKMKKLALQEEGFDITKISDRIYFYLNGKYVSLGQELYTSIISGKQKV